MPRQTKSKTSHFKLLERVGFSFYWLSVVGVFFGLLAVEAYAETYVSGTISQDTTWTLSGSPYIVTGDVNVFKYNGPVTLTLEPDVDVRFGSEIGLYLGYSGNSSYPGALSAQGTAEAPITFTSNAATPAPGNWMGIYFHNYSDDALSVLDHCVVEYGGLLHGSNIYLYSASPTIMTGILTGSYLFL